jgi:hydrogenase maturation protease
MSVPSHPARVIVAGLGNIFLGDDAFGVEVARRLTGRRLPDDVRVIDVGLRSLHLGYELAETRCETLILIDCVRRGQAPGTLYVLEPDDLNDHEPVLEGHAVRPEHVQGIARRLGTQCGRILIVGCEPARFEPASELSVPVAAAADEAVRVVCELCA